MNHTETQTAPTGIKRITFSVAEDTHRRLKACAALKGLTLNGLMSMALAYVVGLEIWKATDVVVTEPPYPREHTWCTTKLCKHVEGAEQDKCPVRVP